jgi:hypothetical protein
MGGANGLKSVPRLNEDNATHYLALAIDCNQPSLMTRLTPAALERFRDGVLRMADRVPACAVSPQAAPVYQQGV